MPKKLSDWQAELREDNKENAIEGMRKVADMLASGDVELLEYDFIKMATGLFMLTIKIKGG